MSDRTNDTAQARAAAFWALSRDTIRSSVANGSLRRMVVDSIEPDGTLVVREVGTNTLHDEPYQAMASPSPYQAGDYVIVGEVMGRGAESGTTRVVMGKAGINSPSTVSRAESNAAASPDATNASVTTWATALQVDVVLPAGTWQVAADGSALMSHNVNQAQWCIEIDGNAPSPHTLSMVTEDRFVAAHNRTLTGGRTITVRFLFRSFTAGTTSARNPTIRVTAVRQ